MSFRFELELQLNTQIIQGSFPLLLRSIHLLLAILALFAGNAQAVEIGRQIKLEAEHPKPIVQPRFVSASPELVAALRFLILLAGQKTQNAYDASGNLSQTIDQLGNVTASFVKSLM